LDEFTLFCVFLLFLLLLLFVLSRDTLAFLILSKLRFDSKFVKKWSAAKRSKLVVASLDSASSSESEDSSGSKVDVIAYIIPVIPATPSIPNVKVLGSSKSIKGRTSDEDTGPGLPGLEGTLTLSTWGCFGVTNLIAATARVPNVCGRVVIRSSGDDSSSFTGTSTTDSLYVCPGR